MNAARRYRFATLAILLLATIACQKTPPPEKLDTSEHLDLPPIPTTQSAGAQTVLEKTFTLKSTATFPFEVPSHTAQPHLHGIFQCFLGTADGPSNEAADIDFVVLNDEQESAIANHQPSRAMFSVEDSHNQAVNVDLPASDDQPVKYYLIFRNRKGSKQPRVIKAQFRLDL